MEVFGLTDRGRQRDENQDAYLVADLGRDSGVGPTGRPSVLSFERGLARTGRVGPRGYLLVVADGMGGATGGATASRLAVEGIHDALVSGWSDAADGTRSAFESALTRAVREAHARIRARAERTPALRGMGTTATAVGVLGRRIHAAQVGDSRAYLIRKGAIVRLTRDQSLVQGLVDSGTLTEEAAQRSGRNHILLQALGSTAEVDVVTSEHDLEQDDQLLLCSDGLFRLVDDLEMARALGDRSEGLPAACTELVELANSRGGPDNITVVAARFTGGA